jgi:hypothetical protein
MPAEQRIIGRMIGMPWLIGLLIIGTSDWLVKRTYPSCRWMSVYDP